ncbi:hypothetical protein AVEN_214414-1 [Araneus ventricosus]|uniref:Uncharacterized protein n=1 Tax=Araneus ventricosus TaxID=182803 RepID=A0A4Y2MIL1_ARAVE|nr:hypothetical protein AVEN_214414-1 [Araneus ventricosus]
MRGGAFVRVRDAALSLYSALVLEDLPVNQGGANTTRAIDDQMCKEITYTPTTTGTKRYKCCKYGHISSISKDEETCP